LVKILPRLKPVASLPRRRSNLKRSLKKSRKSRLLRRRRLRNPVASKSRQLLLRNQSHPRKRRKQLLLHNRSHNQSHNQRRLRRPSNKIFPRRKAASPEIEMRDV